MTMNHLCISKYDIKYRNELGVYLRDDWTSFFDIGKVWEGELLTREEYERVEKNYLDALLDIIPVSYTHLTLPTIILL